MLQNMLTRARKVREDEGGFTLIELLIVIVILGVLAGIVVFSVNGLTDRGAASACKAEVSTVQTAVEAYYAKNGSYPANIAALTTGADKFLRAAPKYVDVNAGGTLVASSVATPSGCTIS